MRLPFAFSPGYQVAGLPFGVTPRTAWAEVDDHLTVRFGPWRLRTPLRNVEDTAVTGDYAFLKTAGPAHLSFADRGVTFATNGDRGLCIRFHEPVAALWPLHHPSATLTVADVDGLREALR